MKTNSLLWMLLQILQEVEENVNWILHIWMNMCALLVFKIIQLTSIQAIYLYTPYIYIGSHTFDGFSQNF